MCTTGARTTPSTGLARVGRGHSAGEGADAAAPMALAATAAAAAAAVAIGSIGQEDNALVLATEAYSVPIGRSYPDVVST